MNSVKKNFLVITITMIFMILISHRVSFSEPSDRIVEGELEAYTNQSVKVKGWYYFVCPEKKGAEDKGLWVYDPTGQEIGFENIGGALRVKIYEKRDERCVWKIKVLEFAR